MSINSQHRRGMMQLGVQALYVEDWCNLDTSNHEGNEQEKHTWKQWSVGAPGYLRYIGDYTYVLPNCLGSVISQYKLIKNQLLENWWFGVAFHHAGHPGMKKHQNKTSNFPINPQIFNPAPISGAMLVYRSVTIPFDYDFTVILENPMNLVVLHNTCCLSCQRVGMLLCSTKKKGQMSIWKKRLKIYMSIGPSKNCAKWIG